MTPFLKQHVKNPMPQRENNLVIGIGNTIRGDDGIGHHFVRQLRKEYSDYFVCEVSNQPDILFSARISGFRHLLIVDAASGDVLSENTPFIYEKITPKTDLRNLPGLISHIIDWSLLLSLSMNLFGSCPSAALLGIRGVSFDISETISKNCQQNAEQAYQFLKWVYGLPEPDGSVMGNHSLPPRFWIGN